jgi:hypothetical protein
VGPHLQGKPKVIREKPVPMPLFPSQVDRRLVWEPCSETENAVFQTLFRRQRKIVKSCY